MATRTTKTLTENAADKAKAQIEKMPDTVTVTLNGNSIQLPSIKKLPILILEEAQELSTEKQAGYLIKETFGADSVEYQFIRRNLNLDNLDDFTKQWVGEGDLV